MNWIVKNLAPLFSRRRDPDSLLALRKPTNGICIHHRDRERQYVSKQYRKTAEKFADVTARLPLFIEEVYNAKRMHSTLGYKSLDQFEAQLARKAAWRFP